MPIDYKYSCRKINWSYKAICDLCQPCFSANSSQDLW